MKKFLAGIAAAAIITVPMTSFALESMSKGALKKATGQAGVSIAVDDIVIYKTSIADVTYWDSDGLTSTSTIAPGSVGAAGIKISHGQNGEVSQLIIIDAIVDPVVPVRDADGNITTAGSHDGKYAATEIARTFGASVQAGILTKQQMGALADGITQQGQGTTSLANATTGAVADAAGEYVNGISPLTIDVGVCRSLSEGFNYNTGGDNNWEQIGAVTETHTGLVAGVVIGLPTVEIKKYSTNEIKTISLAGATGDTVYGTPIAGAVDAINGEASNHKNEFITIEKNGNSTMAILGGRLEIAPH